jgi:hypothetical protein
MQHAWDKLQMHMKASSENQKGTNYLEDLGVERRMALN